MSYYDPLETRDPEEREQGLMDNLVRQVAHAKERSSYYFRALAGINPFDVTSREALARLPLIRRSDLLGLQKKHPPFGGLNSLARTSLKRVFVSSDLYALQGRDIDPWRMARVLYAAGFRHGDLMHNSFSFHFSPLAHIFEAGARKLGCPVFPAGPEQIEQQVRIMADLRPEGYVGPPGFLKTLIDQSDQLGVELALRKASVCGETLSESSRAAFSERGILVRQCYVTAETGAIAYETEAEAGLVVEEDILLEIVHPGTGNPVPPGEIGEVVVTTFDPDYPLIRFATGDLSALIPGRSPCGRSNHRIRGCLGRVGQG